MVGELTRQACLLDEPTPALVPAEFAGNGLAAEKRSVVLTMRKRPLPRLPAQLPWSRTHSGGIT